MSPPKMSPDEMASENIRLSFELAKKCLEDSSYFRNLPNGALIVLLPRDNAELSKANLTQGVQAVKEGTNVFFLHV